MNELALPIAKIYSAVTRLPRYSFEIVNEDDLTWETHNKIHYALNKAYFYRTKTFINKTYGHCLPIKRILCWEDDELVGHTAVFETRANIKGQHILIGGVGLTLSLRPHSLLGLKLREMAVNACKSKNHVFAVGRIKNNPRIKEHLSPLVCCCIDARLIGQSTASHQWEALAIYNTGTPSHYIQNLIKEIETSKKLFIDGEIF